MYKPHSSSNSHANLLVTLRVRRSDLTPLDIAERHGWARLHFDDLRWVALSGAARPSITAIQPVHEASRIPPHAENEDHTPRQRAAHTLETLEAVKCRRTSSNAELIGHAVSGRRTLNVNRCVLDDLAILDVQAADLSEDAVGRWELGDNGEGAGSVNDQTGAVEGAVAEGVVVVAAAVLVANSGGFTFRACAGVDAIDAAGVGGVGGGSIVSFPDVHFIAARAVSLGVGLWVLVVIFQTGKLRGLPRHQ
jgi:hypothetical protein